jgi:hypothetical protein
MRKGAVIAFAAIAVLGACNRGQTSAGDAGPSASASRPLPTAPHPAPQGSAATPSRASLEAHLPCRAIAADGDVHAESDAGAAKVANLAEIPAEGWLSLSDGARLVAKDPRTTRETTFLGPGRVRACVDRREESWIASGSFESVVGAGETPGAEEWVVTAQAVVRYAAARLRVDMAPKGTHLRLANGVAFLWPPQGDATSEGWQRVTAPEVAIDGPPGADPAAAGAAVDRCVSLSERSRTLAKALLSPADSGPAGGSVAAEQVTARRLARAACAVAALRVDALSTGDSGRKLGLSAKVLEAETAWRSLPVAGTPP